MELLKDNLRVAVTVQTTDDNSGRRDEK